MKIGIDFGSTYSMVSKYNSITKHVEAITFSEGEPVSIPSVVSLSKQGKITCGRGAKDQAGKKTVRIFDAFKMLLTETNTDMLTQRGYDSIYTPRVITKCFLESMLRGVMHREGCTEFDNIVICVPEIWGKNFSSLNAQDGRMILRDVLKNDIDIPVKHIRVVTEPEAASAFIAYNYEKETKKSFNGHLLLIDYGGGTLDITLTQVASDGNGTMEIAYREGGGAGENHPDATGGAIGSAGIAYMQRIVELALRDAGVLAQGQAPNYTCADYVAAVRDLETQMKSAERIKEIEDTFDVYGGYHKLGAILKEDPLEFIFLEYEEEEIPVTYQHLYLAYKQTIEGVLDQQIKRINEKVRAHIHADPCEPAAGVRDDFKIALVGGFGTYYLVKKQIARIYKLDSNTKIDLRTKNISADKQEQAISLGAALLAAGKISLQKTARFSIGIYSSSGGDDTKKLFYGIKYHQCVEAGTPYFICKDENLPDEPKNRVVYGGLHGNIDTFAIEFSDLRNHGGLMKLKPEMLAQLRKLPQEGFWNLGFSLDESDVVSFHVVPRIIPGLPSVSKGVVIPLDSYIKMFDLTAIEEVTI